MSALTKPQVTLNYDEAAAYLGVTVRWLRKQVAKGHITFYWLGTRKVCNKEDLDALPEILKALAQNKNGAPRPQPKPRRSQPDENTQPVAVDDDILNLVFGRAAA